MSRIKLNWIWKLLAVIECSTEEGHNYGALGNNVVSEVDVFSHSMREARRNEGDEALNFVDHCVYIGHLGPVSHAKSS